MLLKRFANKPLMIDVSAFEALADVEWFPKDTQEDDVKSCSYKKFNRIAVIPIRGLLTKRSESFGEFSIKYSIC